MAVSNRLDLNRAGAWLTERIEQAALPLSTDTDLDPLLDRIGEAKYVLLGEASHGTAEYYTWRARLSRRLIAEKGFSFIAVEGDWPDCYCVNRYVKEYSECGDSARAVLNEFKRWPTWMWANEEIVEFAEWLRGFNGSLAPERRVGFYGLDVYSLWESLGAVMEYVKRQDGEALAAAKRAFQCFEPFHHDVYQYARAANAFVPVTCEADVVALLQTLRREQAPARPEDREARFVAEQNSRVVSNAEAYYRTMVRGGSESWNLRDTHMADTLDQLMEWHGPRSKAVVWEHNTHVGDARATSMADEGMVNVGQLARERHEPQGVFLAGFGSYGGTVIAAAEWDAPMRRMPVPDARTGSWEWALHQAGYGDKLLLLDALRGDREAEAERGHRAIGVVYHPEFERFGNYVPTELPRRYDAFLFIDRTSALHPLHMAADDAGEPPETFPWNV
jgi:erythromycin esterase